MHVQLGKFLLRLSPRDRTGRLRDWIKESIIIDAEYINKDVVRPVLAIFHGIVSTTRKLERRSTSHLPKNAVFKLVGKRARPLFLSLSLSFREKSKSHPPYSFNVNKASLATSARLIQLK